MGILIHHLVLADWPSSLHSCVLTSVHSHPVHPTLRAITHQRKAMFSRYLDIAAIFIFTSVLVRFSTISLPPFLLLLHSFTPCASGPLLSCAYRSLFKFLLCDR
jgi:hypothetical protein